MRIPQHTPMSTHIEHSFHSVELCNKLVSEGVKSEAIKDDIKRNKEHLQIMLSNQEFADALTSQQRTDIDNCITASETFLAS